MGDKIFSLFRILYFVANIVAWIWHLLLLFLAVYVYQQIFMLQVGLKICMIRIVGSCYSINFSISRESLTWHVPWLSSGHVANSDQCSFWESLKHFDGEFWVSGMYGGLYFELPIIFLFMLGIALHYVFHLAKRKIQISITRSSVGFCSSCGYDLRGLDRECCPECGVLFVVATKVGE